MLWHFVARPVTGTYPLASAWARDALWASLRRRFPRVAAACLMPDHPHLLADADDADDARRAFAQCLAGLARRSGAGPTWQCVPAPSPIPDASHLQRQIRYVHLNPCRDGLVEDPLCWRWSTHRGAVGLELQPWVSPADVSRLLHRTGTARWLHDYVSSDPSVNVAGTPFPIPARRQAIAATPLTDIAAAARAAAPNRVALQRHLFVLLAEHQGWRDAQLIADAAGITSGQVRRLLKRRAPDLLRIGAYYLGDARLRHRHDFRRGAGQGTPNARQTCI